MKSVLLLTSHASLKKVLAPSRPWFPCYCDVSYSLLLEFEITYRK